MAAWWRTFPADDPAYGFVDEHTPEVTIAVEPGWRRRRVGHALLAALHDEARAAGLTQLSLSVERDNPARRLYDQLGYVEVGGHAGAPTMLLDLTTGS